MNSEWKKLRKKAEAQGWRVVPTKGQHLKWYSPDGQHIVVSGSSTSDRRGMANQLSNMRKAGFHE